MVSNSRGIYIAAAKSDVGLASRYMHLVRGLGFVVTHNWTTEADVPGQLSQSDNHLSSTTKRLYAMNDTRAIERADLFWLLAPDSEMRSRGSWFEFGFARGLKKTTLISGAGKGDTVFAELASVQYQTHEAAFEALKSWPK